MVPDVSRPLRGFAHSPFLLRSLYLPLPPPPLSQASPFTGQVESRDTAIAPNLNVNSASADGASVPTFPSVWEALRAGVTSYPELWDYTRARFLAAEAKRKAWRKATQ